MPRFSFQGLADPLVPHHFSLEVQGIEQATFREASGFESSSEVIESREMGPRGTQELSKQPGNIKWADITLKRGMTNSLDLFAWRQLVVDGKIDDARRDGSIVLYNAEGDEISRFNFVRGWPSKWKGPDVNSTSNDAAVEEITLVHEGLMRSS